MYKEMPGTITIDASQAAAKSQDKPKLTTKQVAPAPEPAKNIPAFQHKTRDQDQRGQAQPPAKEIKPAFTLDSKSSKVLGKKAADMDNLGMVSKSYDPETYAQQAGLRQEPAANDGYFYREAGKPDYFDLEADKRLFKIENKSKFGPPEVHYQMSCRSSFT
jgi:hypothetical protein